MISNITNTFIKAKKAFTNEIFNESQNLLNKVLKHDKDFLSAYLLLNLNSDLVLFDFLFNEIEIKLGILLLSFFLLGSLVSLLLEIIYFYKKNKNKEENE